MQRSTSHYTALCATALSLTSVVLAAADDTNAALSQIAELKAQNDALFAKVARLEEHAVEDGDWLTEQRASEIRSIVQDVLADSSSRTSLQSAGATAGWNKDQGGFFLASPSGDFKLVIKGQLQLRWAYNQRDTEGGAPAAGTNTAATDNWGFETRRLKLTFAGFIVDPSWMFEVQPVYARNATNLNNGALENAFIQKDLGGGLLFKVGQFKAPYAQEELVSSGAQLAVERSLVTSFFTTKYEQGMQVEWSNELVRLRGYYGDGFQANGVNVVTNAGASGNYAGSLNTGFNVNETNFAYAGRVEFKGAGTWKQFGDLNSYRGDEFGWLVGTAFMAQNLRNSGAFANANNMWGATSDVTVQFGGATIFAAGYYRNVGLGGPLAVQGGGTSDTMNQWGAVIQGGFFVTDDVEPYLRWEIGNSDSTQFRTGNASNGNYEQLNVATLGANWFPAGVANKNLKITTDLGYAFTPIVDFANSGANWLVDYTPANQDTNDGQWVVRAQFQLLF